MKKRFSEERIIGFVKEADQVMPVKEPCRKCGFSEANFFLWRSKYGGMNAPDVARKVISDGVGPVVVDTRNGFWVATMGLERRPLLAGY